MRRVSILIPAFNAEKFIAASIESALAQSWPSKEVIVVDDGSQDKTLGIARRYEASGVKVIAQPNRGACAARNNAFQNCSGDYIQYLDADDLLASDKIEQQLSRIDQARYSGYVASAAWARIHESLDTAVPNCDSLWEDLEPIEWACRSLGNRQFMHTAGWLVSREIVEKAGAWNEKIWPNPIDDAEFFFRVVLHSHGVLFCPASHSYYRSHYGSRLSSLRTVAAWSGIYRTLETQDKELLLRENSKRTRSALAAAYSHFVYDSYPAVKDLGLRASLRSKILGGANVQPLGGAHFHLLRKLFGWKTARWLQRLAFRMGYERFAQFRRDRALPK